MLCVVILGMSDSNFLASEVLELRYEGELKLECVVDMACRAP